MKVTHDLGQRLQERAPRFALTLRLPTKLKYKRKAFPPTFCSRYLLDGYQDFDCLFFFF